MAVTGIVIGQVAPQGIESVAATLNHGQRDYRRAVARLEQDLRGVTGELQERSRVQAENQYAQDGGEHGQANREAERHLFIGYRFRQVHYLDDSDIVVGGQDAVDPADHGQPGQIAVHGRSEYIYLGHEPDGWRDLGKVLFLFNCFLPRSALPDVNI